MSSSPSLAAIAIYPVKSLDSVSVEQAAVLASGALEHDREFALVDEQGHYVNGKRHARIHQLRSTFSDDWQHITLIATGGDRPATFNLYNDRLALEQWLSNFFGFGVSMIRNSETGFPDDTKLPGPTLVSTATLKTVASWFPNLTVNNVRRRFRANLEIDDVPPFWEDRLVVEAEEGVRFHIGDVSINGMNACMRCIVPTRDPHTGDVIPKFQKTFATNRQQTLPPWATPSRFKSYYRLTVNTTVPPTEADKILHLGDAISLNPEDVSIGAISP